MPNQSAPPNTTNWPPLECDGEGWPVISRDPKEPLPEEFVEKQRVALEALRKDLLRERFERESAEAPVFGWTATAEVWNARAAMFGIVVGLLTEYWTQESIVQQVVDILKVLGFVEL